MPTIDANKAVVRRFVHEVFVAGSLAAVEELIASDAVSIHELVAEGDIVSARLTAAATHTGPFMGMPATGRRYEIEELHLLRVRDGQVVEHWHQFDQMGMMRQLGVGPGAGRRSKRV